MIYYQNIFDGNFGLYRLCNTKTINILQSYVKE